MYVDHGELHTQGVQLFFILKLDEIQYQLKAQYLRRPRHNTIRGIPGILFSTQQQFEIYEDLLDALLHQGSIPGEAELYLTEESKDLVDNLCYVFNSRARSKKFV